MPRLKLSTRPALAALLLLGLALRVLRLDFQPLWWDEGYSVWFAGHSMGEMARLTAADIHPPLYYALLHLWTGPLGFAPAWLRLFSVFASLPAIPLAYALGRDLEGRGAGLIAAGLVALNPLAVFYSQEIRMYGLATTFALAALWSGWRWAQEDAARRFGVAYTLSLIGGFYTLYYFALLPLAQSMWMLLSARARLRQWLAALVPAGLAALPWLLYAGPRLLDYVAYKVVQDNDTPLALLPYLGRHLSAFLNGHLEGALAPLWPWVLLLLLPPLLALVERQYSNAKFQIPNSKRRILYLLLPLLLALSVGYLQQRRAPFIPDRFERVLLFAAPALWLLVALGLRRLGRESLLAALIAGLLFLVANAASLAAFYTTPRYSERDYRPLLADLAREADARDAYFAIYPWQVGYFWAYVQAPGRPGDWAYLSPSDQWGPELQAELDTLLERGSLWFPQHLSLGGILEAEVEGYLDRHCYQLANRWYGNETRLSAWASPPQDPDWLPLEAPVSWQNGVTLGEAAQAPAALTPDRRRLLLDLSWQGEGFVEPANLTFSVWLSDARGRRWAGRDVTPFAHPWPPLAATANGWQNQDHIALTLPAGTPPGEYDLSAALIDSTEQPMALAGANPAPQVWLGAVAVPAGLDLPGRVLPDHPAMAQGRALNFLGHDRAEGEQRTGDDLALSLYWQPQERLDVDYFAFVQLLDGADTVVAGLEEPPLPWLPTSAWLPGLSLRSQHRLRIPATLSAGEYRLIAGLFDPVSGERLPWGGHDYVELGRVAVAERPHDYQPPQPQQALNLRLAGGHRLLGYDLLAGDSPGSPINLTLYWQPAGPTDLRYSTFVHLLDEEDAILDQSDQEPAAGAHPTTSWLPGEIISDGHTLHLPTDFSRGPYRLALGLYHPPTGQRLPFLDDTGAVVSDHLILPLPSG